MTKPTTIYEDNQAALDIMVIGHIAIRVKAIGNYFNLVFPSHHHPSNYRDSRAVLLRKMMVKVKVWIL